MGDDFRARTRLSLALSNLATTIGNETTFEPFKVKIFVVIYPLDEKKMRFRVHFREMSPSCIEIETVSVARSCIFCIFS